MTIQRYESGERMSQMVVHGDTIYLAGQVAQKAGGESVANQTANILAQIDGLLATVGSDKSHLLTATIWIADIADFAEMNGVWDSWVSPGNAPCRACVEAKLAAPKFTVEIMVTAALPG